MYAAMHPRGGSIAASMRMQSRVASHAKVEKSEIAHNRFFSLSLCRPHCGRLHQGSSLKPPKPP